MNPYTHESDMTPVVTSEPLPVFKKPSVARSRNMAAIRSVDTKPEMVVRRGLHRAGFRYRVHNRRLPGSPDVVLRKYRTAVLIHGCFWHGHACQIGHIPRSNADYWRAKILRNMTRDARDLRELCDDGWRVRIVHECTLETDARNLLAVLTAARCAFESS
ncbi:MAG TPA: very short patch repair endonuclease [Dehalococcoidia bacterium]